MGRRVGEGCREVLEGWAPRTASSPNATALPVSSPRRRNGLPPANQVTKPALAQSNFLAPPCTVEGAGLEGTLPSHLPGGGVSAHVSGWWEQAGRTHERPNLCVQELILTRSVFLRSVRVPSWYVDDQGSTTSG